MAGNAPTGWRAPEELRRRIAEGSLLDMVAYYDMYGPPDYEPPDTYGCTCLRCNEPCDACECSLPPD